MLRKSDDRSVASPDALDRVDSVLGAGIAWQGSISGTGGIRIDGAFDGNVSVRGLVIIGEQGRVTSEEIRAVKLIVAGSVKGNITAQRLEIAKSGRVWGDVVTTSFTTEEGAFLRGKITMEEQVDLGFAQETPSEEASEVAEGEAAEG
ncbi:MAG: polymer-forming cytoskeletal protein [Anaerolineales bacterium]|jgi:cytoskeletal protein CcmA (bactofilin family)